MFVNEDMPVSVDCKTSSYFGRPGDPIPEGYMDAYATLPAGCFFSRSWYRDHMRFPAAPFPRTRGTRAARSDRPAFAFGVVATQSPAAVEHPQSGQHGR